MKELNNQFKDSKVEIVSEQQQRKELKLIGKQRKIKGLILWEYNEITREFKPAKYRPLGVFISASPNVMDRTHTFELVVNENCQYVQALNIKNAKRKLGV